MPVQLTCENCNGTFSVKPKDSGRRFCKRSCQTEYERLNGRLAARVPLLTFTCKQCGNPFTMKPSIVTALRKKWGRDPLYCSMPCSDLGRRRDAEEKNKFTCLQCGKINPMRRRPDGKNFYREQKFCDRKCKALHQSAAFDQRLADGNITRRYRRRYSLIMVRDPVTLRRKEVLEHRYVMEQHIGRSLRPGETVHHKNGDPHDNSIANLELFSDRHGPGQRVSDKIAFAIEMIELYPEFARAMGKALIDCDPIPLPILSDGAKLEHQPFSIPT